MVSPVDVARFQWEEGFRRLQALGDEPERYRRAGPVVEAIQDEIQRRLGPEYTAADLSDLYALGTDWCLELAVELAPEDTGSWDSQVVADAAFHLQLRNAADFAGGRLRQRAPEDGG
jgi:hypothetical protein